MRYFRLRAGLARATLHCGASQFDCIPVKRCLILTTEKKRAHNPVTPKVFFILFFWAGLEVLLKQKRNLPAKKKTQKK